MRPFLRYLLRPFLRYLPRPFLRYSLRPSRLTVGSALLLSALAFAPFAAPVAAQQPSPTQFLFAGHLIDGVPPEAQRMAPSALARLVMYNPMPSYPASATSHYGALVQTLVLIDPKGTVANVLASDGPPDLVPYASAAVQQWTFRPSAKGIVATVPLLFQPGGSGQPGQVLYVPQLVRISGGVLASQNTHKVLAARTSGTAVFHVLVDPRGGVAAATMISGPPTSRDAWEAALMEWRYRPYLLNGEPVWVESTVAVSF